MDLNKKQELLAELDVLQKRHGKLRVQILHILDHYNNRKPSEEIVQLLGIISVSAFDLTSALFSTCNQLKREIKAQENYNTRIHQP